MGFPFPPKTATKQPYEPWKLRLLQAKAAYRKWEHCKAEGEPYSWADAEREQWRHESDDEDPALEEPLESSDEEADEDDSWVVRGRRSTELFAGRRVDPALIRRLGRQGGVVEAAQSAIRRSRGQSISLRERAVGTRLSSGGVEAGQWQAESAQPARSRAKRSLDELDEWMEGVVAQPHFGYRVPDGDEEPAAQEVAAALGVRIQHLVGLNRAWCKCRLSLPIWRSRLFAKG